MTRLLLSSLAVAGALSLATACGSSHGAASQQGLRVFDSSGSLRAEITLSSIARRQIRVSPSPTASQPGGADLYLPFTTAGEAKCTRSVKAFVRRVPHARDRHLALAVELGGHVYTLDRVDDESYSQYPSAMCGAGLMPALFLRLKGASPEKLVRALRDARIASIAVGAQRFFFLPGQHAPVLIGCEMDFDMPGLTGVDCFAIKQRPPYDKGVRATMGLSGKVQVCDTIACVGNPAGAATLDYGRSLNLGPFRCTAHKNRVRCGVTSTGRGFILSPYRVEPIH